MNQESFGRIRLISVLVLLLCAVGVYMAYSSSGQESQVAASTAPQVEPPIVPSAAALSKEAPVRSLAPSIDVFKTHVIDETGLPISGAAITSIKSTGRYSEVVHGEWATSQSGDALIPTPLAQASGGAWMFRKPGFATVSHEGALPAEITLHPSPTLAVSVRLPGGAPVSGVGVLAFQEQLSLVAPPKFGDKPPIPGMVSRSAVYGAVTAASGVAVMDTLPRGRYGLSLSSEDYATVSLSHAEVEVQEGRLNVSAVVAPIRCAILRGEKDNLISVELLSLQGCSRVQGDMPALGVTRRRLEAAHPGCKVVVCAVQEDSLASVASLGVAVVGTAPHRQEVLLAAPSVAKIVDCEAGVQEAYGRLLVELVTPSNRKVRGVEVNAAISSIPEFHGVPVRTGVEAQIPKGAYDLAIWNPLLRVKSPVHVEVRSDGDLTHAVIECDREVQNCVVSIRDSEGSVPSQASVECLGEGWRSEFVTYNPGEFDMSAVVGKATIRVMVFGHEVVSREMVVADQIDPPRFLIQLPPK